MSATDYDPELPFLSEFEARVRAHAEQTGYRVVETRVADSRAARTSQRSRPAWSPIGGRRALGGPLAWRMGRRIAILVGLLCLLGATALGARAVFFTHSESPTVVHQGAFVTVAHGHDEGNPWSLHIYTREGDICRALVIVTQGATSRCMPAPGADTLDRKSVV